MRKHDWEKMTQEALQERVNPLTLSGFRGVKAGLAGEYQDWVSENHGGGAIGNIFDYAAMRYGGSPMAYAQGLVKMPEASLPSLPDMGTSGGGKKVPKQSSGLGKRIGYNRATSDTGYIPESSAAYDAANPMGFQPGGMVPGQGSGDKVPIMAEPGEIVIPKDVVEFKGKEFFFNLIDKTKATLGKTSDPHGAPERPEGGLTPYQTGGVVSNNTYDHALLDLPRIAPDEQGFQQWFGNYLQGAPQINPNPDDPRHFYDYRGAYRAGVTPPTGEGHWPSQFKTEGHPHRYVEGRDTKSGIYPIEGNVLPPGYAVGGLIPMKGYAGNGPAEDQEVKFKMPQQGTGFAPPPPPPAIQYKPAYELALPQGKSYTLPGMNPNAPPTALGIPVETGRTAAPKPAATPVPPPAKPDNIAKPSAPKAQPEKGLAAPKAAPKKRTTQKKAAPAAAPPVPAEPMAPPVPGSIGAVMQDERGSTPILYDERGNLGPVSQFDPGEQEKWEAEFAKRERGFGNAIPVQWYTPGGSENINVVSPDAKGKMPALDMPGIGAIRAGLSPEEFRGHAAILSSISAIPTAHERERALIEWEKLPLIQQQIMATIALRNAQADMAYSHAGLYDRGEGQGRGGSHKDWAESEKNANLRASARLLADEIKSGELKGQELIDAKAELKGIRAQLGGKPPAQAPAQPQAEPKIPDGARLARDKKTKKPVGYELNGKHYDLTGKEIK